METKNNQGLMVALVLFIIISLGLGGYIYYDKFLNVDEKIENNNANDTNDTKESTEQTNSKTNEKKLIEDTKYFKTASMQRSINDKIIYIDLGFYKKDEYTVKYDVIINNKIYNEKNGDSIDILLFDPDGLSRMNNEIDEVINLIKNSFDVITSDKDYLYFKTYEVMPTGDPGIHIFVLNETGNVLTTERLVVAGQGISNPKANCQTELYTVEDELGYESYHIGKDSIYILTENDGNNPAGDVDEYKITVNNNKVTKIKTATCEAEVAGASTRN